MFMIISLKAIWIQTHVEFPFLAIWFLLFENSTGPNIINNTKNYFEEIKEL